MLKYRDGAAVIVPTENVRLPISLFDHPLVGFGNDMPPADPLRGAASCFEAFFMLMSADEDLASFISADGGSDD